MAASVQGLEMAASVEKFDPSKAALDGVEKFDLSKAAPDGVEKFDPSKAAPDGVEKFDPSKAAPDGIGACRMSVAGCERAQGHTGHPMRSSEEADIAPKTQKT